MVSYHDLTPGDVFGNEEYHWKVLEVTEKGFRWECIKGWNLGNTGWVLRRDFGSSEDRGANYDFIEVAPW